MFENFHMDLRSFPFVCCFQLFEMGLELSLARLKALAKFAFGIGLPQVHLVQSSGISITLRWFCYLSRLEALTIVIMCSYSYLK